MTTPAPDSNALASLVLLQERARQTADLAELRFILVNETYKLLPYRIASLWIAGVGLSAISGVISLEENAPFVLWSKQLFQHLGDPAAAQASVAFLSTELPEPLQEDYPNWLAQFSLAIPLQPIERLFDGGWLLLTRDSRFEDVELALLDQWAQAWSFSYAARNRSATTWLRRLRRTPGTTTQGQAHSAWWRQLKHYGLWLTLGLAALMLIPVKLSVLAPAELVALQPTFVRAPMDGIIEDIKVSPNQMVSVGDTLFTFDQIALQNKLDVSRHELAATTAEYRQQAQQALSSTDSRARMVLLRSQIDEKTAELDYLMQLGSRSTVKSPRPGVVLFGDPTDWVGRPVVTGERIMVIADEKQTEIQAWLSPSDAIDLEVGSEVTLYLNANPVEPLQGQLRYLAHEAVEQADGRYAYRLRATLKPGQADARIGLRGTARVTGERVSLAYLIFRRPLAAIRSSLGI